MNDPVTFSETMKRLRRSFGLLGIGLLMGGVFWTISLVGASGESRNGFDLSLRSVPLEDILSGGPPRDGIPAIMTPNFVSVSQATFLGENDRILGIVGERAAKAYPIKILNWHEIVNDMVDGHPIVVTYCPLCGSGIGFQTTRSWPHRDIWRIGAALSK